MGRCPNITSGCNTFCLDFSLSGPSHDTPFSGCSAWPGSCVHMVQAALHGAEVKLGHYVHCCHFPPMRDTSNSLTLCKEFFNQQAYARKPNWNKRLLTVESGPLFFCFFSSMWVSWYPTLLLKGDIGQVDLFKKNRFCKSPDLSSTGRAIVTSHSAEALWEASLWRFEKALGPLLIWEREEKEADQMISHIFTVTLRPFVSVIIWF